MKIEELDKNFKVDNEIDKTGLEFYSVDESPFRIYGVFREGDDYRRVPSDIANTVSPGVASLSKNTAGGRVRFVTDSKRLAIRARFKGVEHSAHMPYTNKGGIDIYVDADFVGIFVPPTKSPLESYESLRDLGSKKERVITLNLPLYGALCELFVGVDEGSLLKAAPDYEIESPIVYYGSSITQGGCASRPGMAYQSMISRWLDCDHINLGFSGNAKGEREIVDYMKGLEMSAFVCDYDYNAPTVEHLSETHEPLYKAIREAHPTMPILLVSRPSVINDPGRLARLDVIRTTYENAKAQGDDNVYLLDASDFFEFNSNEHTVDGCHPTDLGFYLMAKGIGKVLAKALGKEI